MKDTTIANCILWKTGEKGSPLLDWVTKLPVMDCFGDAVSCIGGWKCPGCTDQLLSTVTVLHSSYNLEGPYIPTCADCIRLEGSLGHANHGCGFCRGKI
jgi:hypothetical protein